jgi:adenine-specific DNA-methyltransferase
MNNCQVFTPDYIVELMLDKIGYTGDNIRTKTIFEPSFGDGAFLTAIVRRMLDYASERGLSNKETCNILNNIHGVELDKKYYDIAVQKLRDIVSSCGIEYEWPNLVCGNTLHYIPPVKFDLCVANPPYQRIMHIDASVRKEIEANYKFGVGNTDLYVVFFEYCLKAMNDTGKLCFITPNSYFKNSSQAPFRKYLADMNLVQSVIDYGNVKVFDAIATYTAVVLLDFQKKDALTQYTMMKSITDKEYETSTDLRSFEEKPWAFTNPADAVFLKEISERKTKLKDLCEVQHGIATNADKVYIIDKKDFDKFEDEILRPVTKASTLNSDNKIIFPYKWNAESGCYKVINETDMMSKYPKTYQYLTDNRQVLDKRDMEHNNSVWYQYARSQGIRNSGNRKIALKHILSGEDKICEIKELDNKSLVYSGIYIVVKDDKHYELVKHVLLSEEFHKYLFLVGKSMAGGYKNVSAKFVKEYGVEL